MFSKTLSKLALGCLTVGALAFGEEQAAPAATATPTTAPAKAPAAKPAKSMSLSGTVVSTDAIANTLVVKGAKAEETFSLAPTGKIMQGKKELKLADLAKDQKVTVKFMEENGQKMASSIKVSAAAAAPKKAAPTAAAGQ